MTFHQLILDYGRIRTVEVFDTVAEAVQRVLTEGSAKSATISKRGNYSEILYSLDREGIEKLIKFPLTAKRFTEEN